MSKIKGSYDLSIIGAGIIGLATARQVSLRYPKLKVCVIEKENELASHQSKRNSGVVHCGIYYKRGSMKSKFCIRGAELIKQYCRERDISYSQVGKLIVATKNEELNGLQSLLDNARANKIKGIELFNQEQIQRVQPECKNAIEAIWCSNTAIVNWQDVAISYSKEFEQNNGHIIRNFAAADFLPANKGLIHIKEGYSGDIIETKSIINCAGIYSDYFARRTGNNEHPKVVPFKGNYFLLSDRIAKSIKTNIYPVPNPKFPFLGVHITPRLDNSVLLGPTALLVSSFERYGPEDDIKLSHMYHIFLRSGLRKLLFNKDSIKAGLMELRRHYSKKRFAEEVSNLLPGIQEDDLIDTSFCGIRAQVIDRDGRFVDDFIFERGVLPQFRNVLHVRNCPSPAATSSLALSERIVNILEEQIIN